MPCPLCEWAGYRICIGLVHEQSCAECADLTIRRESDQSWARANPRARRGALTGRKNSTLLGSVLGVKSLFDLFNHLARARRHRTIRLQSQIRLVFLKRLWSVSFPQQDVSQ